MRPPDTASASGLPTLDARIRELVPQVLGAVVRRYRDFAAAEDAVQEAIIAAAGQWPREGVPDNPAGWLVRVAARRMTDHIRAETARRRREFIVVSTADLMAPPPDLDSATVADDTLTLFFMCCHPAVSQSAAVALTLRAVGGLTTAEIARAYLVPEATMAQRISRAKAAIRNAGARFELPDARERGSRLAAVMHALYLIFNEGHTASSGTELQRTDLTVEAIRLARELHALVPEEPEVAGLLALMRLAHARRAARIDATGGIVPLDEQDRRLWNRAEIDDATSLLRRFFGKTPPGVYQLQAAIAAVHDDAPSVDATDWPEIVALYTVLQQLSDNPMVALNRAIAVAMVEGPAAGLALVDAIDAAGQLKGSHRLDAVRGHLLERAGRPAEARAAYLSAASRTASTPERNYLLGKAATINDIKTFTPD